MSKVRLNEAQTEQIFLALADSTRRKLLSRLAESSPKTASHFASEFPITRQGILKHLNILKEAGLVEIQERGREKLYSLQPAPFEQVHQWIDDISQKWDERLLNVKRLVEESTDEA